MSQIQYLLLKFHPCWIFRCFSWKWQVHQLAQQNLPKWSHFGQLPTLARSIDESMWPAQARIHLSFSATAGRWELQGYFHRAKIDRKFLLHVPITQSEALRVAWREYHPFQTLKGARTCNRPVLYESAQTSWRRAILARCRIFGTHWLAGLSGVISLWDPKKLPSRSSVD